MPIILRMNSRPAEEHRQARAAARQVNGPSPTPAELRALISAAGITQARAADLARVSLRTVQQWLGGGTPAPPAAVELLCLAIVAEGLRQAGPWLVPWVSPALRALAYRGSLPNVAATPPASA